MNRLIAITISFLLIANTAFTLAWADPCQAIADSESATVAVKITELPPCHQAAPDLVTTTAKVEHQCEQLCLCPSFNFHQTTASLSLSDPLSRVDLSSAFPVVLNEPLSSTLTPPFRPPRINS